jgi:hypothetical protein
MGADGMNAGGRLRRIAIIAAAVIVSAATAWGGEGSAKPQEMNRRAVGVYDTAEGLKEGEAASLLGERAVWTEVAKGSTPETLKGDAVLMNSGIAVVARKGGPIEICALGADGWHRRASVVPLAGDTALSVAAVRVRANDRSAAALEANLTGEGGAEAALTLNIGPGFPGVKTVPQGVTALRVEAPCRFGVLPDFFADDLVVDARRIVVERTEIPSENFFLQMAAGGDSIVGTVWDKNERDVCVRFSGEGDDRIIDEVDVFYGKEGSIWVTVLEEPNIWHSRNLSEEDMRQKAVTLDWEMPFSAKWKANLTRVDGVIESRKFTEGKSKHGTLWTTEEKGKVKAHVPGGAGRKRRGHVDLRGPVVIYPIGRKDDTPVEKLAVVDLMQQSLGVGPCEYILDVAGRKPSTKGIFTCSYGATFGPLAAAGRLKEERVFIRRLNEQVFVFIKHIQDRINQYVDFRGEMLKYLAEQKKKHPEHAEFITKLETQMKVMKEAKANGEKRARETLKALDRAIAVGLPEHMKAARGAVSMIPRIGGGQDSRVARCRHITKVLRIMATMEMAMNPEVSEIAKAVRDKTEAILRNPVGYERPDNW